MAKGYLKFMMLKIISEGDVTGYQIIKRVDQTVGSKPSTGSVYPLLKTMERDGWIEGSTDDGKTVYKVTADGKAQLETHQDHKMDHIMKIHQAITLANETFEGSGQLVFMEQMELLHPMMEEIMDAKHRGVTDEEVGQVLDRARAEISNLKEV